MLGAEDRPKGIDPQQTGGLVAYLMHSPVNQIYRSGVSTPPHIFELTERLQHLRLFVLCNGLAMAP
jgi:hypothetical protein